MSKPRKRKEPEAIIDQIFSILESNGTKTPNEIALTMKANIQTIQRWTRLIKYIQSKPKLIMETGKRVTLLRVEKRE